LNILVTGGTGRLGTVLVSLAAAQGHQVRIASRKPCPSGARNEWATVDLVTGAGVRAAVSGIDAVIHAASDSRNTAAVDVQGTRQLAAEVRDARVPHLIYVSIVGIDRIPYPYYQAKLAAERTIAEAGPGYSILRATQFHPFVDDLLRRAALRWPLLLAIPGGFHVQSVALEDVAERLLRAAREGPRGRLPDFGGPEPMTVRAAARLWKEARRIRKPIVAVPIPGRAAAAFRAGHNTLGHGGERGAVSWRQWLEREALARGRQRGE
jgi:uncharacterized protein YbjT (DUF2867 family)